MDVYIEVKIQPKNWEGALLMQNDKLRKWRLGCEDLLEAELKKIVATMDFNPHKELKDKGK